MKAYLSLGSNQGDRLENIKAATKLIKEKCHVTKISRIYETEPMYYEKQPWFYNAALETETNISPEELLDFISGIEKILGRKKGIKYGPRAIDIDILFYGSMIINKEDLKIPHPLLHERPFVLLPLAEISPALIHPVLKVQTKQLVQACKTREAVRPIPRDYSEMVIYLFSLRRFKDSYSLDLMLEALQKLGRPHLGMKYVHVAGTNGKGSTATMVASILKAAGYRTGLYTSPHLMDFRERISINGRKISKKDVWRLFWKIQPLGPNLTFFEYITLMAFLYFSENMPDFVVLEAGLGGRLDATNVITPLVSVITNISLEHEDILGATVEKIAGEKAGIVKDRIPLVMDCHRKALAEIKKITKEKRSPLFFPIKPKGISFREGSAAFIYGGQRITLRMKGSHQAKNASAAIRVIELLKSNYGLKINPNQIKKGLENAFIPGRCEVHRIGTKTAIFDGAHNPGAISAILSSLNQFRFNRLISVVSIMKDKNIKAMIREIERKSDIVILTKANSYRAAEPKDLASHVRGKKKIHIEKDPLKAFRFSIKLSREGDLILITGSLYLVGNIKGALAGKKIEYPNEMPMKA